MVTGNLYSLADLFSGDDDKVVVPDLQRDYCWAFEKNLAHDFVADLLDMNRDEDHSLGLIYGYYDPLMPNQLNLCDGQQRITTLFLLLGVVNRHCQNRYQELLMSTAELRDDDQEPHLKYAIRESSLFFLSDLTVNYFLQSSATDDTQGGQTTKEMVTAYIYSQPWWLKNVYRLDPTVTNMVEAVAVMEQMLSGRDDLRQFGDFLSQRVKFLFYDLETRENGEQTFVVINTTGEPLTPTENLKSVLVGTDTDKAGRWEEIEQWCWQRRWRRREGREQTEGLDLTSEGCLWTFLRCVSMLKATSEDDFYSRYSERNDDTHKDQKVYSLTFDDVDAVFEAYRYVFDLSLEDMACFHHRSQVCYPFTNADLYAILPAVVFRQRFPKSTKVQVLEVYHTFRNITRYMDVSTTKNAVPVWNAIRSVRLMTCSDVTCLALTEPFASKSLDEPRTKLAILRKQGGDDPDRRLALEEAFAKAESHPVWSGRIGALVRRSGGEDGFDLSRFQRYENVFEQLFDDRNPHRLNLLRGSFLGMGFNDYPLRGTLLGNDPKEWYSIIYQTSVREGNKTNDDLLFDLIDSLVKQEGVDIDTVLRACCDRVPEDSVWHVLTREENEPLLDYSDGKRVRWDNYYGLETIHGKQRPVSVAHALLFMHLGGRLNESWDIPYSDRPGWKVRLCRYYSDSWVNCYVDGQDGKQFIDIVAHSAGDHSVVTFTACHGEGQKTKTDMDWTPYAVSEIRQRLNQLIATSFGN